jgi:1-phosphatidylinositol phosphodiesterase
MYGWPVAQCQSLGSSLSYQLQSGIRVIDIRLAVKEGRLMAYHGVVPQKVSFQQVLSEVYDFLTDPASCRETIVMSIKQEDFATTPPPDFSALVHKEIQMGPGGMEMWFLENRVPMLGEVRGKVIMFSRFGGDGAGWEGGLEGMGIHPARWPDSEKKGFVWSCKNTLVKTQDW